ncbi:unnamed protein product [Owenia fusiformis]|uniref:Uncharacterized protein n=1 Tax=Owenia fusiformis TaxID=6347 RepID=A0A8J1UPB3_OWEFU|nr:unnamed protein product [Owenia fusiformis]
MNVSGQGSPTMQSNATSIMNETILPEACSDFLLPQLTEHLYNLRHPESSSTVNIIRDIFSQLVLPIIMAIGIFGNLFTLLILSQKKMHHKLKPLELSSHIGLVALATSDLLYCLSHFPKAFFPNTVSLDRHLMIYETYHNGFVNLFVMSSTWLTVLIAVSRCLVVCDPLHAEARINVKSVIIAVIIIAIVSIIFTLPRFLALHIQGHVCTWENGTLDMVYLSTQHHDRLIVSESYVYKILGSLINCVAPFIILLVSNVLLIMALMRSQRWQQSNVTNSTHTNTHQSDSTKRLTITLIVIVIFFLVLVTPADMLHFHATFKKLMNESNDGMSEENVSDFNRTEIAIIVLNTIQALNFTINFTLYYIALVPFLRYKLSVQKLCLIIGCCPVFIKYNNNTDNDSNYMEQQQRSIEKFVQEPYR